MDNLYKNKPKAKFKKRYKYFLRTFIIILLILLVPFSSILLMYYMSSVSDTENDILNESQRILDGAKNSMDNLLVSASNAGHYLSISPYVETFCYFGISSVSPPEIQNIHEQVSLITATNKVLDSIWIYSYRKDTFLNLNDNITAKSEEITGDWAKDIIGKNGVTPTFVHNIKYSIYPDLLTFYTPILVNNSIAGCILVNINYEEMTDALNLPEDSKLFTVKNNELIYSSDITALGTNYNSNSLASSTIDIENLTSLEQTIEGNTIFTCDKGVISDMFYIINTDLSYYSYRFNIIPRVMLQYSVVAIIVALIISYVITLQATKPLSKILIALSSSSKKEGLVEDTNDDIVDEIISSVRENDNLHDLLSTRMRLLQDSQIVALQTQINPHFLYNTLEAIKWSAIELTDGDNVASQNIQDLGKLLRYSLTLTPHYTTFNDEMINLNLYLKIVNARYDNKINVIWDVDEKAKICKVPRLLLQPIIENSIEHGLRFISTKRFIQISAQILGNRIRFKINDNGIGIEPGALDAITQRINGMDVFADRHIGLLNVAQRLKLTYGNDAQIHIASKKNDGTTVTIEFSLLD